MVEKFQFGVEAQFAGMLFVVVLLFYLSWTAILVSYHMTNPSCHMTILN